MVKPLKFSLPFSTLESSLLEIRLPVVRRSTIPQKQFIIIMFKLCIMELFTDRQTDRQTNRQIGRQTGRQADWRSLSEVYLGTFETLWWNVFLRQDIWQATLIFDGRPRWEKYRVIDSTFWMDIWIYLFLNKIFIFCSNHPTED